MTTAYTSLLGLALPVTGELSGTWGSVVNDSITSLLDTSVAGTTNVSADSNVTLTTTTGASNQARQAILLFSGARTAIRTVTAPAQSKIYTVINATTGGFAVTLVGAGPTTGVTIANGARTVVAWNGSDFVEVSSPSSIILPGGTANGVLYLNGSKVVTSGSALTFDGTNFAVGTQGEIRAYNTANTRYGRFVTTSDGTVIESFNGSGEPLILSAPQSSAYIGFKVNTAEQGRWNTTGLGIGTTSPAAKVDAFQSSVGTYFLGGGGDNKARQLAITSSTTTNSGDTHTLNAQSGTGVLAFAISSSEKLRLDSSGNLGLGVTPTAVATSDRVLQVRNFLINDNTNGYGIIRYNNYFNGTSDTYLNTGAVSAFQMQGNAFKWYQAASGTAGNAITFTQAMTLDADGDLGIGTTSPAEKLHVVTGTTYAATFNTSVTSASSTRISIGSLTTAAGGTGGSAAIGNTTNHSATAQSNLTFYTHDGTNLNEVGRFDPSGNLGIGTTSPTKRLQVESGSTATGGQAWSHSSGTVYARIGIINPGVDNNTAFGSVTNNSLVFLTNNAERARINESGNLLVGSTSSSFNERIASIHDSSYTFGSYRGGTGSEGHFIFVNGNGAVGSIFTNGSSTSFNTSSDYRLKNITGNLTGYKERLMSLQPKQGTWKANGSEFRGFLAHDFAVPYRASVTGEKDAVDAEGKPIMQAMQASSSEVMADLVAMVNELITENASLKARLDAANL